MENNNVAEPLVSIGLPTYNRSQYLPQALDSLISQSYKNLEIIISDNDSTDETSVLCKEYLLRDPRIKYYKNDRNVGSIANFVKVAELATGEYFMWAADDDYWHREAVSKLMEVYKKFDPFGQNIFLVAPDSLWLVGEFAINYQKTYLSASSPAWKNYLRFLIRFSPLIYGLFKLADLRICLPVAFDPEIPSDGKAWDLLLLTRLFSRTGKNMVVLNLGLHFNRLDTSSQETETKFYKYWLYPKMLSKAILKSDSSYSIFARTFFCICFLVFHYTGLSFKSWG